MKKLTEYTNSGYEFALIKRHGNIAIFRESRHGTYEVIEIQSHQGRVFPNGNEVGPSEYPPSNSQWGTKGFTYPKIQDAESKFLEMIANTNTP